jgi:hypothetical protein
MNARSEHHTVSSRCELEEDSLLQPIYNDLSKEHSNDRPHDSLKGHRVSPTLGHQGDAYSRSKHGDVSFREKVALNMLKCETEESTVNNSPNISKKRIYRSDSPRLCDLVQIPETETEQKQFLP